MTAPADFPVQIQLPAPSCERGIGTAIATLDAPGLIEGVRLDKLSVWPDDRGYFLELVRMGQGLAQDFPRESTQVSTALSYPGAVKAFHYHRFQTDLWFPVTGMLQVALVDLRPASRTFALRNTLYVGSLRPWQILIPPGIGHGYKVIGADPAILVYFTDHYYNPDDEGRIPYDDTNINYDWELQHK